MERIEKVLLLAVLGVALMIVAVMSFLPEGVEPGNKSKSSQVSAATGTGGAGRTGSGTTVPESGSEKDKGIAELIGGSKPGDVGPRTLTPLDGAQPGGGKPDPGKPESGKPDAAKTDGAKTEAGQPGTKPETPGESAGSPGTEPAKPGPAAAPKQDSRLRVAFQYSLDPDYLEYIVQPGDSLQRVMQRVCGTTETLDDVLKVNEELRTNPHLIREGFRLLIPKSAVRPAGKPGGAPVEASISEPTGRAAPAETKPTPLAVTKPPVSERPSVARTEQGVYTVQAGDTLWKIAVRRRGAKAANAYVAQIQENNPAARGTLYPGMRLRLP
jgi:nucleoid-associated protein YgaU